MNKKDRDEIILLITYYAITLLSVSYLCFTVFVYNSIPVTVSLLFINFVVGLSIIITYDFDIIIMLPFIINLICSIGLLMTINI